MKAIKFGILPFCYKKRGRLKKYEEIKTHVFFNLIGEIIKYSLNVSSNRFLATPHPLIRGIMSDCRLYVVYISWDSHNAALDNFGLGTGWSLHLFVLIINSRC